jgi:RNA exonuclease NGL2
MQISCAFRLATNLLHTYIKLNAQSIIKEVDRLDVLLKSLAPGKYEHAFASGRGKKHGLAVLYKQDLFVNHAEKVIYYDEEDVRDGHLQGQSLDEAAYIRWRRGMTRTTRNIGFIVALRNTKDPASGYIVATTHLFWHPAYIYERAR